VDVKRAAWHKSSYSGNNGGECVEVARTRPGFIAIRDSKDPEGPKLACAAASWRAFAYRVKEETRA